MKTTPPGKAPLRLFLALASASATAPAAVLIWDGGAGDGLWTSATNWSSDALPTATDDVQLADGASVTLGDGSSQSVLGLLLGGAGTSGSLALSGGSTLASNGVLSLAADTGRVANIALSGGSSWTHTGSASVGVNTGIVNWTMSDGADFAFDSGSSTIILGNNSGTTVALSLDGAGTTFDGGGHLLRMGRKGAFNLTLTNGASFQADRVDFGIQGEGTPDVQVLSGSTFQTTGTSFTLYNDTRFLVDAATLGVANALVTLSGNATLTGQAGATLTASSGLDLGGASGLGLTGSGTTGTVGASLTLNGTASALTLADSAALNSTGSLSLATLTGTAATITLSGNASWTHDTNGSSLSAAMNGGTVTWNLSGGADFTLNDASNSYPDHSLAGAGSSLNLTVTGSGTRFWSEQDNLNLGSGGDVNIVVSDGATFGSENGYFTLGAASGGTVAMQVLSGASLTFTTSSLDLKNGATLLVDNATVMFGDTFSVTGASTLTVQNGGAFSVQAGDSTFGGTAQVVVDASTFSLVGDTRLDGSSSLTFRNGASVSLDYLSFIGTGNAVSVEGLDTLLTLTSTYVSSSLSSGGTLTVKEGATLELNTPLAFDLYALGNIAPALLITGADTTAWFGGGLTNTRTDGIATFTVSAGASASFGGTVGLTGDHQFTVTGEDSLAFMNALSTGGGAFAVADEATLIATTLELGITAGQSASLTLSDSGVGIPTVRFGTAAIGGTSLADGGSATVDHQSGIFQIGQTSGSAVGLSGSRLVLSGGSLALRNGAQWRSQSSAWIAPETDKSGTVTVQGTDTLFHIDDHLYLGGTASADGGAATFTHSGGVAQIGDSLPTLSGDGFVIANSTADGDGGTLTLRNGAVLNTTGALALATLANTNATITQSGASSWTHDTQGSAFSAAMNGGALTWNISGGADFTLDDASNHYPEHSLAGAGSSLDLTVTGSGSRFWSEQDNLNLGTGGDVNIVVSDGAAFGSEGGYFTLGAASGGTVAMQVLSGASLTFTNSSLDIKNGATLLVDNANVLFGDQFSLTGASTLTVQNGGAFSVHSSESTFDGTAQVVVDASTFSLAGEARIYGTSSFTFRNGATATMGYVSCFGTGNALLVEDLGTTLSLGGNYLWTLADGGSLTVRDGASFTVTGTENFNFYGAGDTPTSVLITGVGTTADFEGGLTNTRTVGTATFTVSAGAGVGFAGDIGLTGTHALTVTGGGSSLSAANLTLGGGGNTLTVSDGGTLTVTGTLGAGAADSIGVEGGAHLHVGTTSVSGSVSIDDGTLHLTADGAPALGSIAVASGGATLDTGAHAISLSAPVSGSGAFAKTGEGTLALSAAGTHSGAFTVSAGTLQLDGSVASSALLVSQGATLTGSGSAAAAALTIAGTLDPGATSAAGLFTAASASFASTANASFQLGGETAGTGHDQLVTSGLTSFGGTLSVTLLDGYAPSVGTSFTLFSAGSYAGAFATRSLPAGYAWDVSRLESEGILSVAAIPEPASCAILLGLVALAGPALRRRPGAR